MPVSVRHRASSGAPRLLTDVLRDVSRAFYLTLRVLPRGVREPVGIAYLLARAADTIADTAMLPPTVRLEHLLAFRGLVEAPQAAERNDILRDLRDAIATAAPSSSQAVASAEATAGEHRLLAALPDAFALYAALPPADRTRVRDIVVTLSGGMETDLRTFPPEGSGELGALTTADELEQYIWSVAGCVGDFWTRVTVAHTRALRGWDEGQMAAIGVRFGKALQLVNVLRDLPRDLRNGRCYLPADELRAVGLEPRDLCTPASQARLRPVLERWLTRAYAYFDEAEQYVLAIPAHCTRLRLAALWPVLIGLATLRRLRAADAWLDGTRRIKISRAEVYGILVQSVPASFSNRLLRVWFARMRRPLAMDATRAGTGGA